MTPIAYVLRFCTSNVKTSLSIYSHCLQLLFMPIGAEGISIGRLTLNQYTAPGFVIAAICLLCVILLFTVFRENHAGIVSDKEKKGKTTARSFYDDCD